jgi:hypothetical protein
MMWPFRKKPNWADEHLDKTTWLAPSNPSVDLSAIVRSLNTNITYGGYVTSSAQKGSHMKNDPEYFGGLAFAEGVVTGMRNWHLDDLNRLTGMVYKQSVWTPGENHAVCNKKRYGYTTPGTLEPVNPDPHDMLNCQHGFYAYYDGSRDYHEKGDITGIIEGYGETVIGTKGFRCMKARIIALKPSGSIPVTKIDTLKRLYPEVEFFTDLHKMLAAHPTDVGGLGYKAEEDPDFWTKEA